MKLIKRTDVTDSVLTSTNVAENDHPAWVVGTAYAIGQKVIVVAAHKIYEAATTSTGLYPPDNLEGVAPAWIYLGSTNAWKMFDQSYYAQTVNTGSIVVVLELGRINSIGLMNVVASEINIKQEVGGVVVYDLDVDMRLRAVNNFYEYIYTPIELKTESVLTDLPTSGGTTLTITISGSIDQEVKCGLCIPGFAIKIGDSLWGATVGTDNFSRKDRDAFGGFDILERNYSKTLSDIIVLPNEKTGYIQNLLQPYYTTPALWVADEQFEATAIYGFYRDFSIVLDHYSQSGIDGAQCSITIEGLT